MIGLPSLHEIAAMPLPASLVAVRKHYDQHWHRFADVEPKELRVSIDYGTYVERTFSIEVEARSVEEAEQLARDALRDEEGYDGRFEVLGVRFRDPNEPEPGPTLFDRFDWPVFMQ